MEQMPLHKVKSELIRIRNFFEINTDENRQTNLDADDVMVVCSTFLDMLQRCYGLKAMVVFMYNTKYNKSADPFTDMELEEILDVIHWIAYHFDDLEGDFEIVPEDYQPEDDEIIFEV